MTIKALRWTVLTLGIGLLVTSLTQKCYCTTDQCGDSWAAFVFGFLGFFAGGAALCWIANPLVILSWLTIKNNRVSLIFSIAAVIMAAAFLLFPDIIANEAGHHHKIVSYETGYWLWLSSMLTTCLGNLVIRSEIRKHGS